MPEKVYVLDTNVLLQSPASLFAFEDNTVVIPEAVLEELDSFKQDHSEVGYSARAVIRMLDELRVQGKPVNGVATPAGGTIIVEGNHTGVTLPANWLLNKADNRILQVCKALQEQKQHVFLVTKDIILRIKAEVLARDFS